MSITKDDAPITLTVSAETANLIKNALMMAQRDCAALARKNEDDEIIAKARGNFLDADHASVMGCLARNSASAYALAAEIVIAAITGQSQDVYTQTRGCGFTDTASECGSCPACQAPPVA